LGLGFLSRKLKRKGIPEEKIIDLIKTKDGVDSLKPLELFELLIKELSIEFIQDFEALKLEIGHEPYEEGLNYLRNKGWVTEVLKVQDFLIQYGDRSFEELKLESLPLKNNPKLFVQLIKWSKQNPSILRSVSHSEQIKLNWIDTKCLNFTRDCIAMREATRLWRGKFYHILRSLTLQLSQQLKTENEQWREFSILDFFSLNHLEWKSYQSGEISFKDVKKLILERRPWQTKRQQYPECIHWIETEKLPGVTNANFLDELEGQGVSQGIAEGTALVLENPTDVLDLDLHNFILVTKNTDPAWIYIMSRGQGLISEKGSLLSHTAIIGRELGIPTIVGVRSATQRIKTGDKLRMSADTGKIEIL